MTKGLCILGSTGSVGQNSLRVVRSLPGRSRVVSLAAGKNLELLAEQVREFEPQVVSVGRLDCVAPLRERLKAAGYRKPVRIVAETAGQVEAATLPEVDFVVSSSHGVTGLRATYEAIRAGKQVGLANKEVLVVAGEVVTRAAAERKVELLPIDSEHGAVHQCLRAGRSQEVRRLILTASGGPFLRTPREEFDAVTPEMALKHPIWKMGSRITIDSATLVNKGLEVIEAHWLFGLPSAQIEVMIHPESVVHSMIEFQDGTIMAQLSVADMRLPIQYALTFPERLAFNGDSLALDLIAVGSLNFEKPDCSRFPCLDLARTALEEGGAMPCALNAADEIAVEAFLARRLRFSGIPRVIEQVMRGTPSVHFDTLDEAFECDREARERARGVVASLLI
ncbi:MAG: 1-deoxy-D-xylulose-5-phosphate reductoisomerase [Acidobacteriia bacterium]|nr:1-deoxy-D-xylulose-5-phosphate reductoisomerase [Terriglobia bacterium]